MAESHVVSALKEKRIQVASQIESLQGLKRHGVTYAQLVEKLGTLGVQETERNLANKISRGGFTGAFLIQCLDAIGCHQLHLD